MIKGIIFDYGGTLDTEGRHWSEVLWDGYKNAGVSVEKPAFLEAYVYAERELGKRPHITPCDTFHTLLLKKIELEFDNLSESGNIPDNLSKPCFIRDIANYCDSAARSIVEKNRTILETLHAKYPMALVTNFYGNISSVIADYGIADCFDTIVESAVVGVRKPSPEIFSIGVQRLGLHPSEVLVVGDSYKKDIEPALTLGCDAVWLKGESWNKREDDINYSKTIYTFESLIKMIF
ncbi:MAG: HAD family hydrolase [Bacteroidales bacterium]